MKPLSPVRPRIFTYTTSPAATGSTPSTTLFPYLYDFTLNDWLYYFPDTKNPGHYTTNPRFFSNLTTGKIFSM